MITFPGIFAVEVAHVFETPNGLLGVLITQLVAGIWLLSWAITTLKKLTEEIKAMAISHESMGKALNRAVSRLAKIETRCAILHGDEYHASSRWPDDDDDDDDDDEDDDKG